MIGTGARGSDTGAFSFPLCRVRRNGTPRKVVPVASSSGDDEGSEKSAVRRPRIPMLRGATFADRVSFWWQQEGDDSTLAEESGNRANVSTSRGHRSSSSKKAVPPGRAPEEQQEPDVKAFGRTRSRNLTFGEARALFGPPNFGSPTDNENASTSTDPRALGQMVHTPKWDTPRSTAGNGSVAKAGHASRAEEAVLPGQATSDMSDLIDTIPCAMTPCVSLSAPLPAKKAAASPSTGSLDTAAKQSMRDASTIATSRNSASTRSVVAFWTPPSSCVSNEEATTGTSSRGSPRKSKKHRSARRSVTLVEESMSAMRSESVQSLAEALEVQSPASNPTERRECEAGQGSAGVSSRAVSRFLDALGKLFSWRRF